MKRTIQGRARVWLARRVLDLAHGFRLFILRGRCGECGEKLVRMKDGSMQCPNLRPDVLTGYGGRA